MSYKNSNISLQNLIQKMIASINTCNHNLHKHKLILDKCHITLYNSLVRINNKKKSDNYIDYLKLRTNLKNNHKKYRKRSALHLLINLITRKYCVVIYRNNYIYYGFSNNLHNDIQKYTKKAVTNTGSVSLDKNFKQEIEKKLELL